MIDSYSYFTLKPEDLRKFVNKENPESEAYLGHRLYPESGNFMGYSGISTLRLSALYFAKFTVTEIIQIYEWVENQLLSSVSATEYKLKEIFGSDNSSKRVLYGPVPGTIRIFSKELVSYYDGKNWKKVKV